MQAALDKLNHEMTKVANPYVQVVGDFLKQFLVSNPNCAEKLLVNNKTILGSLDAMKKEAEKVKVGNCAVMTDQQGFAIVLQYFDINKKITPSEKISTDNMPAKKPVERKVKSKSKKPLKGEVVQTNLFDFLEEG